MARRIMRWLAAAGVTDIVLNLHHLPETITAAVGDGSDLGVRARYSWEQPEVLGLPAGPGRRSTSRRRDVPDRQRRYADRLPLLPLDRVARSRAARSSRWPSFRTRSRSNTAGPASPMDGAVIGFVPRGSARGRFTSSACRSCMRERSPRCRRGAPRIRSATSTRSRSPRARAASARTSVDAPVLGHRHGRGLLGHVARLRARGIASQPPSQAWPRSGAQLIDSIVWDDVAIGAGCKRSARCIVTDGVRVAAGRGACERDPDARPDGGTAVAIPSARRTR